MRRFSGPYFSFDYPANWEVSNVANHGKTVGISYNDFGITTVYYDESLEFKMDKSAFTKWLIFRGVKI